MSQDSWHSVVHVINHVPSVPDGAMQHMCFCSPTSPLVQWEIVLFDAICDRVDQSMKLSTVFVEGMYSNIRRGAIQIYIPLQKYVLQKTLVNIIVDTHEFFYLRAQYNYYSKNKKRRYYRQLDYLIELATLIASQV